MPTYNIRSTYRLYIRAKLRLYQNRRRCFTAQQAINNTYTEGLACFDEAMSPRLYTLDYRFHKFLEGRACRYVYRRALRKGHGVPTPEAIRLGMEQRGYQRRSA